MGGPPTINLLGEIVCVLSILSFNFYFLIFLGVISFLAVAYTLILYSSTQQGVVFLIKDSIYFLSSRELLGCFTHGLNIFLSVLILHFLFV